MTKKQNDVVFYIPYPPTKKGKAAWNKRFGLNAYWAGKHYKARSADAKYIHAITMNAMKGAGIRKDPFVVPVEVIFRWDDRLDIDNHGALGKMIMDVLKWWVLMDDSPRWVKRVVHEVWDGGCVGVEVRGIG